MAETVDGVEFPDGMTALRVVVPVLKEQVASWSEQEREAIQREATEAVVRVFERHTRGSTQAH